MALSERTFGPSLDGSSVYLDTSKSQWLDASSGEGPLHVPGGDFVLEAQYSRLGPDLFLSGEEHSVFVKGYFTHEQAPDLYTTDGSAVVRGSVATRLAGPVTPGQFAQADAVPGVQPIGSILIPQPILQVKIVTRATRSLLLTLIWWRLTSQSFKRR